MGFNQTGQSQSKAVFEDKMACKSMISVRTPLNIASRQISDNDLPEIISLIGAKLEGTSDKLTLRLCKR